MVVHLAGKGTTLKERKPEAKRKAESRHRGRAVSREYPRRSSCPQRRMSGVTRGERAQQVQHPRSLRILWTGVGQPLQPQLTAAARDPRSSISFLVSGGTG